MTNIEKIRAALLGIVSKTEREEALAALEEVAQEVEWRKIRHVECLGEAIEYVETDRCIALNDDGTQKPSSTSYELMCLVRAARAYLELMEQK